MQERTETEEETLPEENTDEASSNNRLYNGFQGSLTEPGDNKVRADIDSSTSTGTPSSIRIGAADFLWSGHLLLMLLLF